MPSSPLGVYKPLPLCDYWLILSTINYCTPLSYRWDYYPEQFSDPIYLEAGQYYFFQIVANQGGGPWDLGLAAKLHCLNETSYPYQGDREKQRINITSTVVREKIVSEIKW